MKRTILAIVLALLMPAIVHAAGPIQDLPHWSVEVKGGRFVPALDNWAYYYGKRYISDYQGTLAYKFLRQLEAGVEIGSARAKGSAIAQLHNSAAGEVTYDLMPVNLFVLVRGVMKEQQWLVPYVGGGLTRIYYQEKVQDQNTIRGSADGFHVRGGIQLALDGIDTSAATSMYIDYGVLHTYWFIEAEYTRAKTRSLSVELGGTAYLTGLLFEF